MSVHDWVLAVSLAAPVAFVGWLIAAAHLSVRPATPSLDAKAQAAVSRREPHPPITAVTG